MQNTHGRSNNSPLWHFVCQQYYNPKSSIFKEDETRPDRHLLYEHALGYMMKTTTTTTPSIAKKSSTLNSHHINRLPSSSSSSNNVCLKCKHSFTDHSHIPQQQQQQQQHRQHQVGDNEERCCYCCQHHQQQKQFKQNQQYSSLQNNNNNNSLNQLNHFINIDNNSNMTIEKTFNNNNSYPIEHIQQGIEQINDDIHVNNVRNRIIEGVSCCLFI
ncbi:unnamed protein product [Schistosoma curassoni]|uniref:GATA zinc finger domain-containing protein 14-like n=1 Tax=Schistosoma curassoni TaxID=6186 RepID=A0A183KDD9_9TREM|nr:unnamed protein product [Schistosoma curassoni]